MSDSSILTVTDSSSAADDMCGLRKWQAYMESRKMVPKNLFAGQQWRNRYREQIYGHGERGGESEIYRESSMEIYITICKTDSQREFAVCLSDLKQGLCINLEWWDGDGDGREVQEGGDICTPVAD